MTTTIGVNPSTRPPPPAYAPGQDPTRLCTIYFRQSADGASFTVTAVCLTGSAAAAAVASSLAEYAFAASVWAAWPGNTAFTYKGKNIDAKAIGKELDVRYVLEGSVQRDGTRVRVNAQLIDAQSGAHLWADRFEEDVADLFKLQDQVVARLANALNYELVRAEAETGWLRSVLAVCAATDEGQQHCHSIARYTESPTT